jgi:sugar (pentulose or hexulose) kinase
MTDATILVFDLGTSYFKGTLFTTDGTLEAVHRVPTPFTNTTAPYSEIGTNAFEAALLDLARRLRDDAPEAYAAVAAVTFSTQTNSFLLLDAANTPLTPIVVWNDRRAMNHTAPLEALAALPNAYETTGVPGFSPEFMAAKLHWFQQEAPDIWRRTRRIALISDYLTWWFTGQFVTEGGAAGLTGLVDIHRLQWRDEALAHLQLNPTYLPEIVRAGTPLGDLLPAIATRFELPEGCSFVVGCLDQYAGAIGASNVRGGTVSETTGTVLATVRCAEAFDTAPGSGVFWGPTSEAGRYYQMVFGDVSANLLDVFQKALPESKSFAELDALAQDADPGTLTLPRDLDTPALLDTVRSWATTQPTGAAVRAVLEGVAEALREQVDQLCGEQLPLAMHSVGGAARSRVWMAVKASKLGVPFRAVDCPEPTSLGAALLAVHGLTGRPLAELVSTRVKLMEKVEPK